MMSGDSVWLIKGADSLGESFQRGVAVKQGDVIRLEHEATRKNLHSHSMPSPLTNQQEVTAFGIAGKGDGNDDWVVDLGGLGEWQFGKPMRLDFRGTGMVLHSHSGHSHPVLTAGLQEVTAYRRGDSNDPWECELVDDVGQPTPIIQRTRATAHTWTKRIFVSHSSRDQKLVSALVQLLRGALELPKNAIRCSTLPGYKLPLGADIDEQIKWELGESEVFIAVLTPHSLKSQYVLFEIGARWGKGRSLGPLLARGTKAKFLGGPISGFNSLRATNQDELLQFLGDIAGQLGIHGRPKASYHAQLRAVIGEARKNVKNSVRRR